MRLKLLQRGDLITVAAPASPFDPGRFRRGVAALEKSGFRITYRPGIFSHQRYLAGEDHRRASELQAALVDRRAKALLFARGGYGSQRLLPFLSTRRFHPKVVVGLSDLTVVLNFLWKNFRVPSLYGPMIVPYLGKPKAVRRLKAALIDPDFFKKQPLTARAVLKEGHASGRLVGGCLSLLVATLGTPYEIETAGSILLLEDLNEEPYQVDRLLTQLIQAGKFKKVRGVVFGTFRLGRDLFPRAIRDVCQERLQGVRGPVLWGVRFGHCPDPLIIPLGGQGRIVGRRLIIDKGIF